MRAHVRKCTTCGGRCLWADDAWVCSRCGDEWYPDHGEMYAPPEPVKTAHDLAADWTWMDDHEAFRIGSGKVEWEQAAYPTRTREYGRRVKVSRLIPLTSKVRVITRYVAPATEVVLVRRKEEQQ